jgi:4a-hydroxytetrahydrobiopterin dehydratase
MEGDIVASELAKMDCIPCRGGVPPLKGEDIEKLYRKLDSGWEVVSEHHLERMFSFDDFRQALDFANKVGALAEAQGHHPDIYLAWGKAKITVWTHKIDGLTESDFVFAAKVDEIDKSA